MSFVLGIEEGPDSPQSDDEYAAWVVCTNCSYKGRAVAPLGEPITAALCPNCETTSLVSLARYEAVAGTRRSSFDAPGEY